MKYVRQAGSNPSFLLKALNEVCGELRQQFYGIPRELLLEPGTGDDEDWCLLSIAVHLRDVEAGFLRQLEAVLSSREPEIPHVDLDDIPLPEDYRGADEDDVLAEFQYNRRHSSYLLWDLSLRQWEQAGIHPYRGRLTVTNIAREMYRHDLEHFWQVRRMVEGLAAR
jgi:hypothetical protein